MTGRTLRIDLLDRKSISNQRKIMIVTYEKLVRESLSTPKMPRKPCCTAFYVQANGETYKTSVSAEVQKNRPYVLRYYIT